MTTRTLTIVLASLLLLPAFAQASDCGDPFGCGNSELKPPVRHSGPWLTGPQAKTETRRQMWIEASGWDYPNFVQADLGNCTRKTATRINCHFGVYQRTDYQNGGPASPKNCHFIAHVWLPRRSSRPQSTVERLGCTQG